MNKQNVNKLALFLTGIEQRMIDNMDFFRKITAAYKSGTKQYIANILLEGQKVKMNFLGRTELMEISWLSARLSKIASEYDSVILTYEERGTTIFIEADHKNVKMKTKETEIEADNIIKSHNETAQISNRDYFIKVGKADELLKEIGILGENGKVKNDKIRKYNQIDHFVELVSDLLKEMASQEEEVVILDCGCGKSYLSFVLNYYIKEVLKKPCYFIGLDYSEQVIEASQRMAKNLGYQNMEFKVTDIQSYHANRKVHLVISLHACDTATDEALALAVNNDVKTMVMVPCCQREILSQYTYEPFEAILKHGILKARLADVLTDGLRSLLLESLGYKVSIVEYVSPLETPKNLMIRAEKVQSTNQKAFEEYQALKKQLGVHPSFEKLIQRGIGI